MPLFEAVQYFPRPLGEVFDFFLRPANLVRISPPELHLKLVEGPERILLGSRIILAGTRWGVPQRVVSEVTAFEQDVLFRDVQKQGPFRKWVHTHSFEATPEGTRVTDRIEFEPPGGLLGLVVNAAFVERDLKWVYEYRSGKLKELLGETNGQTG
jgi:ligand-binding SRPBCC domain-containing protein